MASNVKTAGRRVKRERNVGLRDSCDMLIWNPDLLVFNVILGSFGALLSKWHVTVKRESEWNLGVGGICSLCIGYLWPFSVQGHMRQFGVLISNSPICQKWLAAGQNEWNLGLGVIDHICVYLWPFSVEGHFVNNCLKLAYNSFLVSDYVREEKFQHCSTWRNLNLKYMETWIAQ